MQPRRAFSSSQGQPRTETTPAPVTAQDPTPVDASPVGRIATAAAAAADVIGGTPELGRVADPETALIDAIATGNQLHLLQGARPHVPPLTPSQRQRIEFRPGDVASENRNPFFDLMHDAVSANNGTKLSDMLEQFMAMNIPLPTAGIDIAHLAHVAANLGHTQMAVWLLMFQRHLPDSLALPVGETDRLHRIDVRERGDAGLARRPEVVRRARQALDHEVCRSALLGALDASDGLDTFARLMETMASIDGLAPSDTTLTTFLGFDKQAPDVVGDIARRLAGHGGHGSMLVALGLVEENPDNERTGPVVRGLVDGVFESRAADVYPLLSDAARSCETPAAIAAFTAALSGRSETEFEDMARRCAERGDIHLASAAALCLIDAARFDLVKHLVGFIIAPRTADVDVDVRRERCEVLAENLTGAIIEKARSLARDGEFLVALNGIDVLNRLVADDTVITPSCLRAIRELIATVKSSNGDIELLRSYLNGALLDGGMRSAEKGQVDGVVQTLSLLHLLNGFTTDNVGVLFSMLDEAKKRDDLTLVSIIARINEREYQTMANAWMRSPNSQRARTAPMTANDAMSSTAVPRGRTRVSRFTNTPR